MRTLDAPLCRPGLIVLVDVDSPTSVPTIAGPPFLFDFRHAVSLDCIASHEDGAVGFDFIVPSPENGIGVGIGNDLAIKALDVNWDPVRSLP